MEQMTFETRREAEAARGARADGCCFYVYQSSDGRWALGRYAGRATASGYAEAPLWRVRGTLNGKLVTVEVRAVDHNAAVRAGSHHPYMLCVRECVLVG